MIHVSQLLGRLFLGFFFRCIGGSEPHWLDKEKAEPSESAGVIGGSRAPKKQKRSGKSAAATQKSAAARMRREKLWKKTWKNVVVFRFRG